MNKLKPVLLFFAVLFLCGALKAQTLDEGKKFMYYERYKSAKSVFEKLVAANITEKIILFSVFHSQSHFLFQKKLFPAAGKPF